jgi:uncharacterized membrane protein HdeD (DUF308 family)
MAFFLSIWHAMKEIVIAPFFLPELWWQLIPILVLWITLEFYLNYHKREQLGWNSALANGLTLFWIGVGAMQPLFTLAVGEQVPWANFFMILPMILYGVFLTYASFTHKMHDQLVNHLASPTVVHYLSIFAILWGNKVLEVNKYILLAFFLLWFVAMGVRWLLFWLLPEMTHGEEHQQKKTHGKELEF